MRKSARNHSPDALHRARIFRKEMSASEKVFWELVRKDRLGLRFHRQVPIGPYTLDFYCPAAKVAVEIDGEQHDAIRDEARDLYLEKEEILTVRIPSLALFGREPLEGELALERLRLVLKQRSKR